MRRLCLTVPILSLFAVAALAGCRTQAAVAAYVEDITISTAELAAAVEQRLDDENVAAVVEPGDPDYQRLVLSQLLQQTSYRILGNNYGVSVTDRQVEDKLAELLSGDTTQSVEDVYAQLASERLLSQIDVRENVRQALIRERIAAAEDLDGPIEEPALRERYEQIKEQLSTVEFGYLTAPDQAAADATLALLLADPTTYEAFAATYAGPFTQPTLLRSPPAEVPAPLVSSVLQTSVGQGFTVAVPDTGGIVVGYVASLEVPEFDEVREEIRTEAADAVDAAVGEVVTEFVAGLEIDINPRYGSLDQGEVVPVNGGVVQILEDAGADGTDDGTGT